MSTMVGGVGQARPVDDELRSVVSQVRGDIEAKAGKQFETFEPVSYATQVVAGTHFFIKVNVGDSHLHAKVFRSLPPVSFEVKEVQLGKTAEDPVNSF
ncbi:hypothetical protein PTSG_02962 [Salpingoeca rosetta]|uniref:Cystatin domain-containing protein n=1 Tax=Salpingoeca rosetta (strain ATCC 50818 / BSB-021) TaxID=946362 RepID=F2U3V0_SALR5|nr:uncharacterized protein PTSG_02962 [Salpingoeca rosetta]EGD82294.1 hypothetical protein PTSG_02962 [Salpingoeca rosetta]|eukprot:XP_004996477.1 hypothetical protein PTSG_02962 [Salpingoeca rosetta]